VKSATAWRDGPPLHLALAMSASILLHLTLLVALQPALPAQEERFSQQAVEVTLEKALAPPAAPAAPAMAQAGQARAPGSIDLVQSALAPGPVDSALPLQRPLSEPPAALPVSSAWRPAEAALAKAVTHLEQPPVATMREPATGAPSAAARSPDALDRVQAPPTPQPRREAAYRASQQNPAAPSASPATGAPARRIDTASHASQRDAQQDYVLLVVRKLSQARFSTEAEPHRSASGAVIARLTVDRDGNLVGLSLAKDSGATGIDRSILENVRKAAPFAPLPKDLAGSRFSFILPIKYAQEP
jgi:protein TonB